MVMFPVERLLVFVIEPSAGKLLVY